jgi:hypothetical protein
MPSRRKRCASDYSENCETVTGTLIGNQKRCPVFTKKVCVPNSYNPAIEPMTLGAFRESGAMMPYSQDYHPSPYMYNHNTNSDYPPQNNVQPNYCTVAQFNSYTLAKKYSELIQIRLDFLQRFYERVIIKLQNGVSRADVNVYMFAKLREYTTYETHLKRITHAPTL